MNCADVSVKLDEYLDGLLSPRERSSVDEHLERCTACRAELADLKSLVERAGSLPDTVLPERDLWNDIESRIGGKPFRNRFSGQMHLPESLSLRRLSAAAAVLLLCLAATVIAVSINSSTGADIAKDFDSAGTEYLRASETLQAVFTARKKFLDPDVREVLDRDLVEIDRSIAEIRHALKQDPANIRLHRFLLDSYRNRTELLRWAADLSVRMQGGG